MSLSPPDVGRRPAPSLTNAIAAPPASVAREPARPSAAYRRAVVAALTLVATFNVVDRQILAVLLEPVRRDLGASDAQLGLLTGFAFVAFYAAASVPLARVADRGSRRGVIVVALAFWSAMTALSGAAASVVHLALARVGLGVGEAASGPAAQSLLSDLFPADRRAPALSWIAAGVPLGLLVAFAGGSRFEAALGWRATFLVLGAVGVALALVVALVVREPARAAAGDGVDASFPSARDTLRRLLRTPGFAWLLAGASCNAFAASVMLGWGPAFLARVHGMSGASAGAWLGAAAGVGGVAGTVLGGVVAQALARRDRRWWLGVPAASGALAAPMLLLFLALPARLAVLAAFGVLLFGPAMLGPVMTVTQGVAAPRERAFAAALVPLVYHLLGWGLGPLCVGALSDALAPALGAEGLRWAMGVGVVAVLASAATFAAGARRLAGVELR